MPCKIPSTISAVERSDRVFNAQYQGATVMAGNSQLNNAVGRRHMQITSGEGANEPVDGRVG